MYYIIILVLLFVAELFILEWLINVILLISLINVVAIHEPPCGVGGLSSTSGHWLSFSESIRIPLVYSCSDAYHIY